MAFHPQTGATELLLLRVGCGVGGQRRAVGERERERESSEEESWNLTKLKAKSPQPLLIPAGSRKSDPVNCLLRPLKSPLKVRQSRPDALVTSLESPSPLPMEDPRRGIGKLGRRV